MVMLLGGLATLGLLSICGCAGGWQGSRPVAPTTITQPENQTVNVGRTATFSVTASGTGPFSYQWYNDGVAISGATSSTYTTPATVMGDTGSVVTVTVTNATGSVTSLAATLTVKAIPPTITIQPASQPCCPDKSATFSRKRHWSVGLPMVQKRRCDQRRHVQHLHDAIDLPADSGSVYTVTVSNFAGNATSNGATLTVHSSTP